MPTIKEFQGEFRFLSNFWPAEVLYDGASWNSAEHAYQSAKTLILAEKRQIHRAKTPGEAKKFGKTCTLREGWEHLCINIMRQIVFTKFAMNPELRRKLIATYPATLEEGNRWGDTFWGICNGRGENHLGEILVEVRGKLR